MQNDQPQPPSLSLYEEAAAMVRRLQSELHDMTPDEQDFVMSVLNQGEVGSRQLDCLRGLVEKFDV